MKSTEREVIIKHLKSMMLELAKEESDHSKDNYVALFRTSQIKHYIGYEICKLKELTVGRGHGN